MQAEFDTDECDLVRQLIGEIGAGLDREAPEARAMTGWVKQNHSWLAGQYALALDRKQYKNWDEFYPALMAAEKQPIAAPCPDNLAGGDDQALQLIARLGELLRLPDAERRMLFWFVATVLLPRLESLFKALCEKKLCRLRMIGKLSGLPASQANSLARNSKLVQLGLIKLRKFGTEPVEIEFGWTLQRILRVMPQGDADLLALLLGKSREGQLQPEDFAHIGARDFLAALLKGAQDQNAKGVNIFIHGPPGTGKTEFAHMLAQNIGVQLHSVGEANDWGDEPGRYDRIAALQLASHVLRGQSGHILLFDEMEDLIGDAAPGSGDWMDGRQGSKIFINRLLEENPVPVIWISNAIDNIDPAILRRMSHVLKMDYPSARVSARIYANIARTHCQPVSEDVSAILRAAPEAMGVLANSARASALAAKGGGSEAQFLPQAVRALAEPLHGRPIRDKHAGPVDLSLYQCDHDLGQLLAGFAQHMANGVQPDMKILLSGPPGTGKTALARHMAEHLDLPLMERRASDLLSKWAGETEANIAAAFTGAEREGALLFFDEADSLFFDRKNAHNNWEVGQVNELLGWLDRHPWPVMAATNAPERLDAAALRRFDFKLALRALDGEKLKAAFRLFFEQEPPAWLDQIIQLTPGDFAAVKRQLRYAPAPPDAHAVLARLREEAAHKPGNSDKIGFQAPGR